MLSTLLKGPFAAAGCSYERDGWITTDPRTGENMKWRPADKKTFRWNASEARWLPSHESREEFLVLARQYWSRLHSKS